MTDPNDAELSALLRQGRTSMPRPSPAFEARVIRAYEKRVANRAGWRRLLSFRFAVPLPVAAMAVVTLLTLGFAVGAAVRSSIRSKEIVQEGPWDPKAKPKSENLTNEDARILGGLQVVAELRPRVLGGANEAE